MVHNTAASSAAQVWSEAVASKWRLTECIYSVSGAQNLPVKTVVKHRSLQNQADRCDLVIAAWVKH